MKYGASPRRGNMYALGSALKTAFNDATQSSDVMAGIGSMVNQAASGLISGGLQSGVGNAIGNVGNTVGGLVSKVNPVMGAAIQAGSGVVSGITNTLFGSKLNEENIQAVKEGNSALNNAAVSHGSTASALSDFGGLDFGADFAKSDIGRDGLFSNTAANKFNELKSAQHLARGRAMSSLGSAASAIASNQASSSMANYSAFGGPLGSNGLDEDYVNEYANGGGIHIKKANRGKFTEAAHRAGYSDVQAYASHVLDDPNASPTLKKRANFARNASRWHALGGGLFASGGSVATNGANFSQGYTNIGAGGAHETNQYEGVQKGVDPDGNPNLVEEGEVVWNNYVFSRRIPVPEELRKALKLGKKEISFADAARKLGAGTKERPNDAIERRGQDAALERLMQAQEQVRQAMAQQQQQEQAQQQQFMQALAAQQQQQAQQQQMAQNPLMQGQMDQGQMMQDPITQEQMAQQQMEQDQLMQMAAQQDQGLEGYACGGRVNRFGDGGVKLTISNSMDPWNEKVHYKDDKEIYGVTTPKYTTSELVGANPYLHLTPEELGKMEDMPATGSFDIDGNAVNYDDLNFDTKTRGSWNDLMETAPIYGSLFNLGKDLFGKRDYTNPEAIRNAANVVRNAYSPISPQMQGSYITAPILSPDLYTTPWRQAVAAGVRANQNNNGANQAARDASNLALFNSALGNLGSAVESGREANFKNALAAGQYNFGINSANQSADLAAQTQNLTGRLGAAKDYLSGMIQSADMRQNLSNYYDNMRRSDWTDLMENIGKLGTTRKWRNMLETSPWLAYDVDSEGVVHYKPAVAKAANLGACGGYLTMRGKKRRK